MEAIQASGIDYTIFFYNPNIHPQKEYLIRKDENIRFADQHGVPFIDADNGFERAKGMEWEPERGIRCTICFDMRHSARNSNFSHEIAENRSCTEMSAPRSKRIVSSSAECQKRSTLGVRAMLPE